MQTKREYILFVGRNGTAGECLTFFAKPVNDPLRAGIPVTGLADFAEELHLAETELRALQSVARGEGFRSVKLTASQDELQRAGFQVVEPRSPEAMFSSGS